MDAYLEDRMDRGETLWVATLSDGRLIYQDDGRPGTEGGAWQRLGHLLRREELAITSLRLRFRTEWWDGLPSGAPAYFFSRGVGSLLGEPCHSFCSVGYLRGDSLRVARVIVPDLVVIHWEDRNLPGVPDSRILPGLPLEYLHNQ